MNNEGGGIVDRRDHDRCRELYVKYRQFMYWYVKKHFPDLPEEDIRDILQEVWTSLSNAIDKLYDKGDEGQFAWLIRVTQTKVIDYYRSRRRTEELGEKIGLALREQQEVGSVQDIVIARMIAMELVEGLTEEERRILAIEYFSDADEAGCAERSKKVLGYSGRNVGNLPAPCIRMMLFTSP